MYLCAHMHKHTDTYPFDTTVLFTNCLKPFYRPLGLPDSQRTILVVGSLQPLKVFLYRFMPGQSQTSCSPLFLQFELTLLKSKIVLQIEVDFCLPFETQFPLSFSTFLRFSFGFGSYGIVVTAVIDNFLEHNFREESVYHIKLEKEQI